MKMIIAAIIIIHAIISVWIFQYYPLTGLFVGFAPYVAIPFMLLDGANWWQKILTGIIAIFWLFNFF